MKSLRDLGSFFVALQEWKGWEFCLRFSGNSEEVVSMLNLYLGKEANGSPELPSELEAHRFLCEISAQMPDLVKSQGFEGFVSIRSIVWTISSGIASRKLEIPVQTRPLAEAREQIVKGSALDLGRVTLEILSQFEYSHGEKQS